MPPQRVWFSSRFGLKTGIDFDHYGLNSGMVFKGTTGAYKRICLLNSKWIVEKEKYPKCIIRAEYYQLLTSLLIRSRNYGKTKVWKPVWILGTRSHETGSKMVPIQKSCRIGLLFTRNLLTVPSIRSRSGPKTGPPKKQVQFLEPFRSQTDPSPCKYLDRFLLVLRRHFESYNVYSAHA